MQTFNLFSDKYRIKLRRKKGEHPDKMKHLGSVVQGNMSRVIRKQTFCICENKDADQPRGNREADQRLWIRYIDSTIPLLS